MATHSNILAWRIPGTGETWWAAIYGVTRSQTRLKRLSSSSSLEESLLFSQKTLTHNKLKPKEIKA